MVRPRWPAPDLRHKPRARRRRWGSRSLWLDHFQYHRVHSCTPSSGRGSVLLIEPGRGLHCGSFDWLCRPVLGPSGPGLKFEEVPASFAGTYRSRSQPLYFGSCGLVLPNKPVAFPDPCTVVVRIQPWLLDHRRQTVLAVEHGPTLWVIAGGVGLTLRGRDHRLAAPMLKRRWYELRIIVEDGRIWLRQTALQRSWGVTDSGEAEFPG